MVALSGQIGHFKTPYHTNKISINILVNMNITVNWDIAVHIRYIIVD